MDRLNQDLLFFKQQLAVERNQIRRNLLMRQIRDVLQQQKNILLEERNRAERQFLNLKEALDSANNKKK